MTTARPSRPNARRSESPPLGPRRPPRAVHAARARRRAVASVTMRRSRRRGPDKSRAGTASQDFTVSQPARPGRPRQAPAFRGAPGGGIRAGGPSLRSRAGKPARRGLVRRAVVLGAPAPLRLRRDRHRERRLARLDDAGRAGGAARADRGGAGRRSRRRELDRRTGARRLRGFRRGHGRRRGGEPRGGAARVRALRAARSGSAGPVPGRAARGHPLLRRRHRVPRRHRAGDPEPGHRALESGAARSCRDDGRQRVLLGIPGNHDWYDGLDGFGRMFRRRPPGVEAARARGRRVAADAAALRGVGARVRARRRRRQARGARALGLHAGAERELLRSPARARHRPPRGRSPAHGDRFPPARVPGARHTGPRPIRRRSSCCPIRCTTSAIRAGRARRWSRACASTRRRARPSC